jgi:multiple sugar transport system ATP-binding protein
MEITLDQVGKTFPDGTEAVKNVSFTIEDGEFFILLGPSGCGKSTILNMIAGLEDVTTGVVRVGGKVVNDLDPRERNMAMVFQSYALYPHMSVRENMEFPLKLAGLAREEKEKRVRRAARVLELEGLLDRMPGALSGGQRQRVAMGRAIVREPSAFLLDEPLSNLDAKLRVQMRTEIGGLQRKLGTTMVYVTHDQTEAMTLGSRLALLRKGRLLQLGTPRELYTEPRSLFVAGFIGSPAMNFLPGTRRGDTLELPMLQIPVDVLPGNRNLPENMIAGLRPEHIFPVGEKGNGRHTFEARADMIEWLGADAYVHFEMDAPGEAEALSLPEDLDRRMTRNGRIPMTARLDPARKVNPGETLTLGLDVEKLHLFDAHSGEAL